MKTRSYSEARAEALWPVWMTLMLNTSLLYLFYSGQTPPRKVDLHEATAPNRAEFLHTDEI